MTDPDRRANTLLLKNQKQKENLRPRNIIRLTAWSYPAYWETLETHSEDFADPNPHAEYWTEGMNKKK